MKRVFLYSLLSLLLFIPVHAQSKKASVFKVNPFFKDKITATDLRSKLHRTKAAAYECASYAELVNLITENGKLRNGTLSVHLSYDFPIANLGNIIKQAVYDATTSDDYLLFSTLAYYAEWEGDNNDATVDLQLTFHTTLADEQYVTMKIAGILGGIITDSMTDLQKEKAVYDWIIQHVQYDYSYTYYSAYDALYRGKTVCNGYALLMYRMINALGINVRIAPGYGGGELHAWNMVFLCGKWYHADATWDDPNTNTNAVNYDYFNLSDAEIEAKDHIIGADPEIFADVPVASSSFSNTACTSYNRPGTAPATPELVSPASGSTDVSLTPDLAAEAFSDVDGLNTHFKTLWQISLDAAFTQCIYYDTSEEYLTTFDIPAEASLPDNRTLYWRVRYFDSDLNPSGWSNVFSFTTLEQPTTPQTPVILSPADGISISVKPRLNTEAFVDGDRWDTHTGTHWQLSTTSDFSDLYLDEESDTDLLTLAFSNRNLLPELTTFYWRARYLDSDGAYSPWSETRSFTTKAMPEGGSGTSEDSGCFIASSRY